MGEPRSSAFPRSGVSNEARGTSYGPQLLGHDFSNVSFVDMRQPSESGRAVRLDPRPLPLVGRDKLASELRTRLVEGAAPRPRMVALHGLGGTGKTSLALAHAYSCLDDAAVSDAWQFPAWDDTMLQASFGQLATVLGVAKQRQRPSAVHSVHSVLADREKPWLLVFDNAHDYSSLSEYLPPAGNGQVVITSQNAVGWPHGLNLGIPVLDTASAARFLVEGTDDLDEGAAGALAAELGGLPLALEQARAYIQATGFSLAGYLAAVREHPDVLGRGRAAGYDKTVATTWTLAFSMVEQNSAVAAGLLRLLACCAPEPVPLQLLLRPRHGAEHPFGPAVAPLLGAMLSDPLTALEAVAELQNFSLLSLMGPAKDRLVQVHRLVRTVTALDMRRDHPGLGDQWHEAAVALIEAAVPAEVSNPRSWPTCGQLLPHALQVLPAGSDGLGRIANYLGETGSYSAARNLQRDIAGARARQLSPTDPRTLSTRHDLALWTGQAGDPVTARDQLGALLPVERETLGESHPQVLATRHNLASLTGEAGDPAAARDEFAALLALRAQLFSPDHPGTLAARHEVARWTGEAGEPAAARDQLQALLPDVRRVHGDGDPRTIAARHELARWTGEAGDPRAARGQLNAIIREEEIVRGAEHPWVLTARHEAAIWTGLAGDPRAAHLLLAELLPVCRQTYGPDHQDTVAVARDVDLWGERAAETGTDAGQEREPAVLAPDTATAAPPPAGPADGAPAGGSDHQPQDEESPGAERPVRVSRGFTRKGGTRLRFATAVKVIPAAAAACVLVSISIAMATHSVATHAASSAASPVYTQDQNQRAIDECTDSTVDGCLSGPASLQTGTSALVAAFVARIAPAEATKGVTFAFTYQAGSLPAGSVRVAGSGSVNAVVDFSTVTEADVTIDGGSVVVIAPYPKFGVPVVDQGKTTVSVNNGPATGIGSVDQVTAQQALHAARLKIASAGEPHLIAAAEAKAESVVSQRLLALGFSRVAVIFQHAP